MAASLPAGKGRYHGLAQKPAVEDSLGKLKFEEETQRGRKKEKCQIKVMQTLLNDF